jgi:hypothetical protein
MENENILFDFIQKHIPLSEEEKQSIIDLGIFNIARKGDILSEVLL